MPVGCRRRKNGRFFWTEVEHIMSDVSQMPNDLFTEDDHVDSSSRRRTIVLSVSAFLLSYVMTAGPAAFILNKMDLPVVTAIAEIVYAPVILIVKMKIPVLSGLIKAYLGIFT